ncbi:hypothetical protein MGG_04057 [Pyricularia oryzae 70-15]|uniref:lytic cellulose monooxygenase (C4-dehydrogenating) n=1 Tax=Pyricularia oryzae (strain 70-15 / ATCC MYA-4617 / FGSC 8958) TaxID=242507 RepID=G4NGQ5_PYRO7|nr:uncharacterized protein MGG_04057 [Pyricularia oryzae 70-15]EHA47415.1 hypothetical protein MGG_04057 [Pyricularia oryzae 70-15]KAI7924179.1 hypothetical protein M9X92_003968 [Pyricularia oryzae]
MKLGFATVAVAILASGANAHYWFDKLIINGRETSAYQYVRQSSRPTLYNPIKWIDTRDNSTPDMDDMRCNQGAFNSAGRTQTAEVAAGTRVGFRLAAGGTMFHPGPGLAYMSRAPGTASTYRGDGDWFKIYETGVCRQGADFSRDAWCTYEKPTMEFNIPKDTPNGEYLLRVEHIGVHRSHVNQPEFYVSCAQIKVVNGGSGRPGPTIKFPGGYSRNHPAFENYSVYNGYRSFPMPGPAVWSGGGGGGSTPAPPSGGCAALYEQCGGSGFNGPKCCSSGSCKVSNEWYSQCFIGRSFMYKGFEFDSRHSLVTVHT